MKHATQPAPLSGAPKGLTMRLYPWILAIRALNRHPFLFWGILAAVLYLLGEMKPIPH